MLKSNLVRHGNAQGGVLLCGMVCASPDVSMSHEYLSAGTHREGMSAGEDITGTHRESMSTGEDIIGTHREGVSAGGDIMGAYREGMGGGKAYDKWWRA